MKVMGKYVLIAASANAEAARFVSEHLGFYAEIAPVERVVELSVGADVVILDATHDVNLPAGKFLVTIGGPDWRVALRHALAS